jgi:hypothetical protein
MISRLKAAFDAAGMGLDFLLFGNGHGLAAPYFPERFIWIGGRFYTWIGGHGAQMVSREWRAPPAPGAPNDRRSSVHAIPNKALRTARRGFLDHGRSTEGPERG